MERFAPGRNDGEMYGSLGGVGKQGPGQVPQFDLTLTPPTRHFLFPPLIYPIPIAEWWWWWWWK